MITAFNRYFSENTTILKACLEYSGIGKRMAQQILDRAHLTSNIKIGKISASKLSEIKSIIDQNYEVDNERRVSLDKNIRNLSSISCYRGFRHYLGLPCRGQRTHSNARTSKKLKKK